jgi:hypothetical protein
MCIFIKNRLLTNIHMGLGPLECNGICSCAESLMAKDSADGICTSRE